MSTTRSFSLDGFGFSAGSSKKVYLNADASGREVLSVDASGYDDVDQTDLMDVQFQMKSNEPERIGDKTDAKECCSCPECLCSCHVRLGVDEPLLPIDSYVVYFFDYELFSVPRNMYSFEILVEYLRRERIFDRSYVVSVSSDTQRDGYAMIVPGSGRSNTESQIERSEFSSNLFRYRPSVVESLDDTRSDIRQLFRGLIVQGSKHDWYTVRASLNFPSLIVYVKMTHSRNDIQANHTIFVDMSHRSFISTPGSVGLKIARILAYERAKYFNVPHFDFRSLVEQTNLRDIQRSAVQEEQRQMAESENAD